MLKTLVKSVVLAVMTTVTVATAMAESVNVKAVMAPKQSMKMNFEDGTKHFVLLVRREGQSDGTGSLSNAEVTESGWHDINPPHGGHPQGYLQFKAANGDIANIKFTVRAVFVQDDAKPRLIDYGFWELVSGTGQFANQVGVGYLTIKPASKTDRLFTLEGELGQRP